MLKRKVFYKKGQLGECLLFHISFDNYRTKESRNKVLSDFGCCTYFEEYKDYLKIGALTTQGFKATMFDLEKTSIFSCSYEGRTGSKPPVATLVPKKPRPKKASPVPLFDVIAGTGSSEVGAARQVVLLKELGYHQSKYYRGSDGMFRVVALSSQDRLHADCAKHVLKKEHKIDAYVIGHGAKLPKGKDARFAGY